MWNTLYSIKSLLSVQACVQNNNKIRCRLETSPATEQHNNNNDYYIEYRIHIKEKLDAQHRKQNKIVISNYFQIMQKKHWTVNYLNFFERTCYLSKEWMMTKNSFSSNGQKTVDQKYTFTNSLDGVALAGKCVGGNMAAVNGPIIQYSIFCLFSFAKTSLNL